MEKEKNKSKEDAKTKEKNIHSGHRARLFEVAEKNGIFNLPPHQVVEILLTYIFPRGDVNPLAHELINKFGSFYEILEADPLELATVKGMNVRSAQKLSQLLNIFNYYAEDKISRTIISLTNVSELCDFVEQLLRFRREEEFYIVGLDNRNALKGKLLLKGGTSSRVVIRKEDIVRFILNYKPAMCFVAHNHPNGKALPSVHDIESTEKLKALLKSLDIFYYDSLIVGEDGIFSINKNYYLKYFRKISLLDDDLNEIEDEEKYQLAQENISNY